MVTLSYLAQWSGMSERGSRSHEPTTIPFATLQDTVYHELAQTQIVGWIT